MLHPVYMPAMGPMEGTVLMPDTDPNDISIATEKATGKNPIYPELASADATL